MRRSIRTRLFVTFIGLAVVPLLMVVLILAWQSFNVQQQESLRSQHDQASNVSTQVKAFISGLESQLQMLVRVRGVKNLNYEQQKSILSELVLYQNNFEELALVNNDGQELARASTLSVVTTADLANRAKVVEFLTPMSTGKVYYSPVHINPTSGEPFMTLAVPYIDLRSGRPDGVLIAEIRFKPIWDLVAHIETGENDTIYILDAQKRVVAHADPSVILKGTHFDITPQNGVQQGLAGNNVVLSTDEVQFGDQVFTIVTERPASVALALGFNVVLVTAVVVLVFLLLAGVIGYLTVRQIVQPVQSLASTAQAIMIGDFTQRPQVRSQDEIGQMALAFNEMIAAVQKREADLRQQAEELRIATAKAREAARIKGEFLSTMSHELRTPLNAIIGFSDMLLLGMFGPLNDKQRHKMERLKENGNRLLSLINDLLDLTRIESGRMEIAQKPFSPQALAERMKAQMDSLAEQSKLKFETYVSPDMPPTIKGDEKRVEQIIVNLLSNAFKFTKEGSVTLNIEVNLADQTWSLAVADTGVGIPPHALSLIFEEFRQLDGSYSRAYKGSGLGLAITRNLVRIMDGKISVKSTLDVGSTFTVTLPLAIGSVAELAVPQVMAN